MEERQAKVVGWSGSWRGSMPPGSWRLTQHNMDLWEIFNKILIHVVVKTNTSLMCMICLQTSQGAQVMQIFSHTLLNTDMPPKDAPHKQMLITQG